MKKRILAILLTSIMLVPTLTGCGNTATEKIKTGDSKVLKIAAFEGGYGKVYWEKLKVNFEKSHEGVTVELTTASNLAEVIRPQIQAGNVPDLVYLATGGKEALTETFIKDQALSDLSGVLSKKVPGENVTVKEKILPGFLDTAATNPYGDGKTYLAPLFYSPTGLFYDKHLFAQKGYTLPKTWDEMFVLGDKAKADGISLFTYATTGYFDCVMPPLLASNGGMQTVNNAFNYKEGFWKSTEAKTALDTIGKIKNYLEPSVVGNANKQGFTKNQQLVLDDKALFIPNGNWLPDEMKDAPRTNGFEWGFMPYPSYKAGDKQYSVSFLEQMYIPKDAANKDLAGDFMAYMYSDEAVAIIAENAKAVVPVTGCMKIAEKYLAPLQVELFKIYDNGAIPIMGGYAATTPVEGVNWTDISLGTIDSVMTGTKSVDDWQKALDEASSKLKAAVIK